jgi:hypothetical protein
MNELTGVTSNIKQDSFVPKDNKRTEPSPDLYVKSGIPWNAILYNGNRIIS